MRKVKANPESMEAQDEAEQAESLQSEPEVEPEPVKPVVASRAPVGRYEEHLRRLHAGGK